MSELTESLRALLEGEGGVVDVRGRWSGAQLDARSRAGATLLAAQAEAGARVGLLVEPGGPWVTSMLAIWRAGMVPVPLSPLYPTPEITALLDDADATLVVVDDALRDRIEGRPTVAPGRLWETDGDTIAPRDDGATALMLFTSGTTGRPKGVCITDANLAHQARLLREAWRLDEGTHLVHALPLHHMHGIAIALWPTLLAGGTAELLPRFDAAQVWDALDRGNTLMAVPTMYHRLLGAFDEEASARDRRAAAARRLRLATSGSAALPVTLAERWQSLAGAIPLERYGMTEIGVACSNPFPPADRRRGTVGPPLPTQELRLVDDEGAPVEPEAEGEVWIRGPSVFAQYWRRPEATASSFVDGWFRTGDQGRFEGGYLRLLGRRSVDIIKCGGYKLSALEMEEVLRDHPAVEQVAVVGVDDPAWGERTVAAVVASEALEPEALRTWAKERIAAYKVPREVRLVAALPRNALGKVLKPAVVAMLTDA